MGLAIPHAPERQDEIIRHVLDELGKGRALTRILNEDGNLPVVSTWFKWEANLPGLTEQVAHARELGAATRLDEIIDIADECTNDVSIEYDKDGTPRAKVEGDVIARAKLRIYAREKYAQMIAPRRFGAKVDVTTDGKALPAPQVHNDNRVQTLIQTALERRQEKARLKDIFDD